MTKCEKCGHDIKKEKKGIKIVSKYNSERVIFQSSKETIKEAVVEAVKSYANLSYADLSDANLSYANLSGAKLKGAKFNNAHIGDNDSQCAVLAGANLEGVIDMSKAQKSYASKQGAINIPE